MSRILYLHGFASSTLSRKAIFFKERLAERGLPVEIPDLAEGDFEHLTIGGQLAVMERLIAREPVKLIGSSMGGYLAALYAARHSEVESVVLLAPALNFATNFSEQIGAAAMAEWQRTGKRMVLHYGLGRAVPLDYGLAVDAARYEAYPNFHQPALIVHGVSDPVVPVGFSEIFAKQHVNVKLVSVPSGHELTDVLPQVWAESEPYLIPKMG